jgi:hypothetical protein
MFCHFTEASSLFLNTISTVSSTRMPQDNSGAYSEPSISKIKKKTAAYLPLLIPQSVLKTNI